MPLKAKPPTKVYKTVISVSGRNWRQTPCPKKGLETLHQDSIQKEFSCFSAQAFSDDFIPPFHRRPSSQREPRPSPPSPNRPSLSPQEPSSADILDSPQSYPAQKPTAEIGEPGLQTHGVSDFSGVGARHSEELRTSMPLYLQPLPAARRSRFRPRQAERAAEDPSRWQRWVPRSPGGPAPAARASGLPLSSFLGLASPGRRPPLRSSPLFPRTCPYLPVCPLAPRRARVTLQCPGQSTAVCQLS